MHLSVANGAQTIGQSFPTNLEAVTEAVGREHVDLQRRLAPDGTVTLLFTDIEGSTPLAERLGDVRWFALLREHNAVVRQQIARFGGFEVKTIGDAFMIAFGSARRGVLCAVGIQEAISRYGVAHPDQAVRVRIGPHAGEPVREGNDFYGKSVVLASRVAGTASGGEILVSALIREPDGEPRRHSVRRRPGDRAEGLRKNAPSVPRARGVMVPSIDRARTVPD